LASRWAKESWLRQIAPKGNLPFFFLFRQTLFFFLRKRKGLLARLGYPRFYDSVKLYMGFRIY